MPGPQEIEKQQQHRIEGGIITLRKINPPPFLFTSRFSRASLPSLSPCYVDYGLACFATTIQLCIQMHTNSSGWLTWKELPKRSVGGRRRGIERGPCPVVDRIRGEVRAAVENETKETGDTCARARGTIMLSAIVTSEIGNECPCRANETRTWASSAESLQSLAASLRIVG